MIKNISPINNEQPSSYAGRLEVAYTKTVSLAFKKENGQLAIARFMGSLVSTNKTQINILPPPAADDNWFCDGGFRTTEKLKNTD